MLIGRITLSTSTENPKPVRGKGNFDGLGGNVNFVVDKEAEGTIYGVLLEKNVDKNGVII